MPRHIAIVDDDPFICGLLSRFLTRHKFHVTAVDSSQAAIELIKEEPAVDLFIIDVLLGEDDGIELCREIHEKKPNLPLILLTGIQLTDDTFLAAIKECKAAVFSKQDGVDGLLDEIRRALGLSRRAAQNEGGPTPA